MEKQLKPGRFLKSRMTKEYVEKLKDSQSLFITDFEGLTNKDLAALRKKLRGVNSKYLVVKSSLCISALKELKLDNVAEGIDSACAISYAGTDPVAVSKILVDFAKTNENLKLKSGYIDGAIVDLNMIRELAAMPSRDALLARLVYVLNSPVTGLVSVCSGIVKKLLYVINDIIKKREEGK